MKKLIQRDSPTASKGAMRILLTIAASKQWVIKTTDIKSAFLQGKELNRNVYLKPPKESEALDGIIWTKTLLIWTEGWFQTILLKCE